MTNPIASPDPVVRKKTRPNYSGFVIGILILLLIVLVWWPLQPETPSNEIGYFVSWQAVLDPETVDRLTSHLNRIPVDVSERLQEEEADAGEQAEIILEGYRGNADQIRSFLKDLLSSRKPVPLTDTVHWNEIPRLEPDQTTGQGFDFTQHFAELTRLTEPVSIGNGVITWNLIQIASTNVDQGESLKGFPYFEFEAYPKSGNAVRIAAQGRMGFHISKHDQNASHVEKLSQSKMAEISWSQTIRDRDAILLMTRFTDNGEPKIVVSVCERIDLLPGLETQSPVACDMRAWLDEGPERISGLLEKSREWEAEADPELLTEEKWTQHLPDGRAVTLIAIGRQLDAPFLWWTPEGKPIRSELFGDLKEFGMDAPGVAVLLVSPGREAQSIPRDIDLREQPQGFMRSISREGPIYRLLDYSRSEKAINADLCMSALMIPVASKEDVKRGQINVLFGVGEWVSIGNMEKGMDIEATLDGRVVKILETLDLSDLHDFATFVTVNIQLKSTEESKLRAAHRD
ncbi:MAG: hypothetical protein KDA68_22415, partial [Planctomycetaceae bacterium]|nr:hypothetical protein [Planctomycetaceae bacterium]